MSSAQNPGVIITNVIGGLSSTVFAALIGMVLVGASTYASRKGKGTSQGDSGVYSGSTNKTKMIAPSSYNPPYNPSSAVSRDERKPTVSSASASVTAAVPVTQSPSAPEQEPTLNLNPNVNPNQDAETPRPVEGSDRMQGEREANANPAVDDALKRQDTSNNAARIRREREAADAARRQQEDAARRKREQEEADRIKQEQEEAARRKREQEEAAQGKREQEEADKAAANAKKSKKELKLSDKENAHYYVIYYGLLPTENANGSYTKYNLSRIWSNNTNNQHLLLNITKYKNLFSRDVDEDTIKQNIQQKIKGTIVQEVFPSLVTDREDVMKVLRDVISSQKDYTRYLKSILEKDKQKSLTGTDKYLKPVLFKFVVFEADIQTGGNHVHYKYEYTNLLLQFASIYLVKLIRYELYTKQKSKYLVYDVLLTICSSIFLTVFIEPKLFMLIILDSVLSMIILYVFQNKLRSDKLYHIIFFPYFAIYYLVPRV